VEVAPEMKKKKNLKNQKKKKTKNRTSGRKIQIQAKWYPTHTIIGTSF